MSTTSSPPTDFIDLLQRANKSERETVLSYIVTLQANDTSTQRAQKWILSYIDAKWKEEEYPPERLRDFWHNNLSFEERYIPEIVYKVIELGHSYLGSGRYFPGTIFSNDDEELSYRFKHDPKAYIALTMNKCFDWRKNAGSPNTIS